MCVLFLPLVDEEEALWEKVPLQPLSKASTVTSLRLPLTAWTTEHIRLNGLVEKVRRAVYWIAMEANASRTIDFHEQGMVAGQMHQDTARQDPKTKDQESYMNLSFFLVCWFAL